MVIGIVVKDVLTSSSILSDGISLLSLGNLSQGLIVASLPMTLCLISAAVLWNGEGGGDIPVQILAAHPVVLPGILDYEICLVDLPPPTE